MYLPEDWLFSKVTYLVNSPLVWYPGRQVYSAIEPNSCPFDKLTVNKDPFAKFGQGSEGT
ncbi:hypothetical protein DPMN_171468 [Dreissena polymorpha]|uniref:Uncharacterized protein n=1 Tax=Dreissena polymorpha TaxID=45954 RepID=A0A9D4E0H0_DREPO|nr:hypothetical protein DPMN_171468 [Dreissena polymorpha]